MMYMKPERGGVQDRWCRTSVRRSRFCHRLQLLTTRKFNVNKFNIDCKKEMHQEVVGLSLFFMVYKFWEL